MLTGALAMRARSQRPKAKEIEEHNRENEGDDGEDRHADKINRIHEAKLRNAGKAESAKCSRNYSHAGVKSAPVNNGRGGGIKRTLTLGAAHTALPSPPSR